MHDAAFARAAVPAPIRILKLPLRPFSVGHLLRLQAADNPLAEETGGAGIRPYHVIEAVWICAHTWQELNTMHERYLTLFKIGIWRRRTRGCDLALAAADFQNYRREGSGCPPVEGMGGAGRIAGAPLLARVIQFLVDRLRIEATEAMDYPLGLAYYHFATHQETEGELKVLNEGEIEFADWCRAQDLEEERKRRGAGRKKEGVSHA